MGRRLVLAGLLALSSLACENEWNSGCPELGTLDVELTQGASYELELSSPIDTATVGTVWRGQGLAQSPLRRMMEPPVILKADDLRPWIEPGFRRYLEAVTERGVKATVGLITEGMDGSSNEDLRCIGSYDARKLEVWFHGADHYQHGELAEFKHVGIARQREHMLSGLEAMDRTLGLVPHTFGAPGNATDEETVMVLAEHPEIEVIFYAPVVPGRLLLSSSVSLEDPVLFVRPKDVFARELDSTLVNGPLTLQGHPETWDEPMWQEFGAILDFLIEDRHRRFSTAIAYKRWLDDAERISVTKLSDFLYQVDAADARNEHLLELDLPGLVRFESVERPILEQAPAP